MSANLVYAVGTLASWAGWFLFFRAIVLIAQMFGDKRRVSSGLAGTAVAAGVCFVVASLMKMQPDAAATSASAPGVWRFPLVWFVMPWTAWLGIIALVFVIWRSLQAGMAMDSKERMVRLQSAGLWLAAGLVFAWLYKSDPGSKIEVLKGGIGLKPDTAIAILLFAVAGTVAMVLAGRGAQTRGYGKAIVAQAALLAGAFVFGLPFAFLLVTSFKEDRDMSSVNGIIWIPRVQETVPFFDKKDPLFEAQYEGQTVQASIIEKNPDGSVKLDIQKPMAIRGLTFVAQPSQLKEIPKEANVFRGKFNGVDFVGKVVEEMDDGRRRIEFMQPPSLAGQQSLFALADLDPVRHIGLRTQNYPDALDFLPPETNRGMVYLKNTLVIVVFSVIGTILSSAIVAYAFSRMRFPGRNALFTLMLGTMMLPGAVTMMPQFLIFRAFGWIDTLMPLWVPAFFGSAFNIFLLRQFFMQIPLELEDAAKIDGCSYPKTFWSIMMPQIKPALAVIAIWTFVGAWNNFMGPLIYVNSPENMPLSYALKLFQGDRSGEPGLLMAFATLTVIPVLALFFFCQRYFIEGVTLSGLGGR
ncbi:carbohydrate ABC transporter permease [Fimbriimonas ginsengisoli]|uniref:N-Acetyl-D-glucosamine ABC transport system, permease protein 2 n=1 Tax=Fimbriimonas ginsengisoli Gsoil 348 TaxID=661478 RepID=A0A068NQM7_FIMGI|nr:carbohydrate ABC transporter permease [Fimbriimonas ginsengisoli]AIE85736.1 N-Acetyl-D-glucosamine ABC transport system, permease protein 2 [Fimbriimonas ginsengisoli Gsoil 348]